MYGARYTCADPGGHMKRMVIVLGAVATAALATLGTTAYAATRPASPTAGHTRYTDSYKVQKPYNLAQSARFSAKAGVYSTWILKGDKPLSKGIHNGPRTEM